MRRWLGDAARAHTNHWPPEHLCKCALFLHDCHPVHSKVVTTPAHNQLTAPGSLAIGCEPAASCPVVVLGKPSVWPRKRSAAIWTVCFSGRPWCAASPSGIANDDRLSGAGSTNGRRRELPSSREEDRTPLSAGHGRGHESGGCCWTTTTALELTGGSQPWVT